jgi:hypothetical protein
MRTWTKSITDISIKEAAARVLSPRTDQFDAADPVQAQRRNQSFAAAPAVGGSPTISNASEWPVDHRPTI